MEPEFEEARERRRPLRYLLWALPVVLVVVLAVLFGPGLAKLRGAEKPEVIPMPELRSEPAPTPAETSAEPADDWSAYAALALGDDPDSAGLEGADEVGESMMDCIIEPFEIVDLGSPVTGVIQAVVVERGDLVSAGQIVAKLESNVEEAAVEVARARAAMKGRIRSREARLTLGKQRQERAQQLYESEAMSLDQQQEVQTEAVLARSELREARENRGLAELELKQALASLKRRFILSPLSGVVVTRHLSPGEVVDEDTILTIAQIDPLRVEVILPAAMFGKIEPGMRATVVPELRSDDIHVASVTIVDRVIDPASGTFGARLELPNPDGKIPSGLHCEVRFLDE